MPNASVMKGKSNHPIHLYEHFISSLPRLCNVTANCCNTHRHNLDVNNLLLCSKGHDEPAWASAAGAYQENAVLVPENVKNSLLTYSFPNAKQLFPGFFTFFYAF